MGQMLKDSYESGHDSVWPQLTSVYGASAPGQCPCMGNENIVFHTCYHRNTLTWPLRGLGILTNSSSREQQHFITELSLAIHFPTHEEIIKLLGVRHRLYLMTDVHEFKWTRQTYFKVNILLGLCLWGRVVPSEELKVRCIDRKKEQILNLLCCWTKYSGARSSGKRPNSYSGKEESKILEYLVADAQSNSWE